MCGIAGILPYKHHGADYRAALLRALGAMNHRGPDGADAFIQEGICYLGHRLLEITTSGQHGVQPISSEDGGLVLAANGEIYNHGDLRTELESRGHVFSGDSDCEVILHGFEEWGDSIEERLSGSWAFALWESGEERLRLSRDPFGIKQLYYADTGTEVVFASEIRTLLAMRLVPLRLSVEGLIHYLGWQSVPGPGTILEGVSTLLPGGGLVFEKGRPVRAITRSIAKGLGGCEDTPQIAAIEDALVGAVGKRLPDKVGSGLLFSGGLDSSLLAAVAARRFNYPLKLFSLGFEGHDGDFDESGRAGEVAALLGLEHMVYTPCDGEIPGLFEDFLGHLDHPSTDAFNTHLACSIAGGKTSVLFTGAGADELFLGYPHLVKGRLPASGLLQPFLSHSTWERFGLAPVFSSLRRIADPFSVRRLFTDSEIHALLRDDCVSRILPGRKARTEEGRKGLNPYEHDLSVYLPFTLLRDFDTNTMAFGIEGRTPYLDRELARLVLSVPLARRADGGKGILRRVASGYLPPMYADVEKKGFELPFLRWTQGPLKRSMEALRDGPPLDILRRERVNMLLDRHAKGLVNPRKVFSLMVLSGWMSRVIP